ncbi:MAG: hypothetical protein M3442_21260 [Chloroflexota bacterium]|nr:hypothetical protein [Chloroflexota bacterium]
MSSITLEGVEGATGREVDATLERLAQEDVLGQLLRREGRMAQLATEGDDVKLDWVDGVERALAAPEQLDGAAAEGAEIAGRGLRHVIWSGMGGSVQTVYTLKRMGYLDAPSLTIHPLDSTDPAALNRILAAIGAPAGSRGRNLADALAQTMMIGVSMGMTSEEPITHLEWFDSLLRQHGVPDPGSHIQVMTLPGSYLDDFARPRGSRMVPIQIDGENHTPGRMSAPATRVFLRPVALMLAAAGASGGLRAILQRGQDLYRLAHSIPAAERRTDTAADPFLRLAAWIALRAPARQTTTMQSTPGRGAPKLLVTLPPGWEGFAPWLEQLVEESLGKQGQGFLVFYGQSPEGRYGEDCAVLRIAVEGYAAPPPGPPALTDRTGAALTLRVPATTLPGVPPQLAGLGELAGLFLGFKKTVATYGYLQDIVYAGQPAVEAYKKYARDLRESPGPVALDAGASGAGASGSAGDAAGKGRIAWQPSELALPGAGPIWLDYSSLLRRGLLDETSLQEQVRRQGGDAADAADILAAILTAARAAGSLRYLDVTWNGELSPDLRLIFQDARDVLANETLGIPAKLRTGPSDYHSTEQGETDGPPELVSLRLVAERHEAIAAGTYDDTFLLAQARGTWQAMEDAGRWIVFITVPQADAPPAELSSQASADVSTEAPTEVSNVTSTAAYASDALAQLFERVDQRLKQEGD